MITKHPTSRTLIIHPFGDLDTLRAEHYRRQLRSLIEEGYRFLIFDLQDTPYVNSSGLGLLIEFYNSTRRLEGAVKLINCSAQVLWILKQTKLDKILLDAPGAEQPKTRELHYDSVYPFMSDEILLLTRIREATENVLKLNDITAIGDLILKGIADALHATRGALYLYDENFDCLTLAGWFGAGEQAAPPECAMAALKPGCLEYKIFTENTVTWHELGDRDQSEGNLFYRLGYETLLAAPIHGNLKKYGMIIVEAGPDTTKIVQASKPLVCTFTNLCGLAMDKASLTQAMLLQNESHCTAIEKARDYQHSLIDAGKLAALGVVISGLAHMINNKMVPLLGYAQMLSQRKDLSEWVSDKVSRIQASGHEMTQIVEKLVKISNTREKSTKSIDHTELIRTVLDLLACQIERKKIVMHVHAETSPAPIIQGNPNMLLQALLAILHRACTSFAPDDSERWIRIVTQSNPEGLRIIIEDNGAPFQDYDQDGWLDPLAPFDALGTGLIFNYTIPRNIIRRQHGTLILENPSHHGKRVIVDLPIVKDPSHGNILQPLSAPSC